MSKSLKEILSTPIKDTTVSEIRLQVVVGLPLPLIIIYFISLFSPYFISFSFGFLVLGVYMFFIKNIEKCIHENEDFVTAILHVFKNFCTLIYIVKKKVKSILLRVYV